MSRPALSNEPSIKTHFNHQPQHSIADRYIDPSSINPSNNLNGNGNHSQAKRDESLSNNQSINDSTDRTINESEFDREKNNIDSSLNLPSINQPTDRMSVTSAQSAGTAESSPFFKVLQSNLAMKTDDSMNHSKDDQSKEMNFERAEMIDVEKSMNFHHKNDPVIEAAEKAIDSAQQTPPKRRRVSIAGDHESAGTGGTGNHTPQTPSTPHAHTLTGKEKRSSCTAALLRSLEAVDGVDDISAERRAELARDVEEALYLSHPTLNHGYVTAARDLAYNLYHNQSAARRLLDGRISPKVLAQMDWKSLAVKELKIERAEEAHRDLINHLAPQDVVPGIQPNSETTAK